MLPRHSLVLAATVTLTLSHSTAWADGSNVDSQSKTSWCGNTGWMNWRDAGNGLRGALFDGARLSGFVWAENIGWINLGDGTPESGPWYANVDGADFGVNVLYNSGSRVMYLWGYAWSENAGWIHTALAGATGGVGVAYLDASTRRLRGNLWGSNIGWIILDDAATYVAFVCAADVDDGSGGGVPDGGVTIDDLLFYLQIFEAGDLRSDVDDGTSAGIRDGGVTIDDLLYFLARFESGC